MDNEKQILQHQKTPEEIETASGCGLACPSHQTVHRSADESIYPATDIQRCRECLGAVTHRLAQPLTALRGGIELGLMGKRPVADYRAVLEQSLQLADSMVEMIASLRDLGEASMHGGIPQSVSLRTAIQEVLTEMEGLARSRNLRLELDAEGVVKVSADPERLGNAFQSLFAWVIQNSACSGSIAVKLSESKAKVQVHISPPRLDLQYIQIKILDEIPVPGILFSRAAKNGALGWAINQRLFDALGGDLQMLSPTPKSSCICVSLPSEITG